MSRRKIKRGARSAKPEEPRAIDPQAKRRWEQRQADDNAVIDLLKAGDLDLVRGHWAREVAAGLGWTQGRLRAAIDRILANTRANQRAAKKEKP